MMISASASAPSRLRLLDEEVLRWARTRGHSPRAERRVARFSRLGEHGAVWLALGVAGQALDRAQKDRWRRMTRTIALTYGLNTAIKLAVRRRRPELAGLPPLTSTPSRLSFPSAHASTSFVAAQLFRRLGLPALPLYGLASALSLSRLYLGVHYPSDVLAGALLGSAVAGSVAFAHPLPATGRESESNGTIPIRPATAPAAQPYWDRPSR
jgi:membrane-associated phospholipid phosphatase